MLAAVFIEMSAHTYWVQNNNLVCMCHDQTELSEFHPLNYSSSHSLRIIGFLIITDCWRLSLYKVVLVLFPFFKKNCSHLVDYCGVERK